jgi:hypothetical protein
LDINTKAEAPSFNVEALAAVTVPFSLWNTVGSVPILSKLTDLYSSSSAKIMGSPFLCGMETGTISSAKFQGIVQGGKYFV